MLCFYFSILIAICGIIAAIVFLPDKFDVKPQQFKSNLQEDIKEIIQRSYSRYNTTSFANVVIDKLQEDFQCCGSNNFTDWYNSLQNNATRTDIGVGAASVSYVVADAPIRKYGTSSGSPQSLQQLYYSQPYDTRSQTVTASFRVPVSCCSTRNSENSLNQCKSMIARYDANPSDQQMQRIPNVNQDGCVEKIYNYVFVVNWWPLNIVGGLAIGLQGLSIIFSFCLCCAINRAMDDEYDEEEK